MISPAISSTRFVSYCRVSTARQGQSGLGLEAQKDAVTRYVETQSGKIIAEFVETESGKKAHNRPELRAALELCRKEHGVLLIAKLDRLSRNVHFVSGLLESGVNFLAVDSPNSDRLLLHVQAAFAEEEARRISQRTKAALAIAIARGVQVGATGRLLAERHRSEAVRRAQQYRPFVLNALATGAKTTLDFREALNLAGVVSPGGGRWHLPNVHALLKRLGVRLRRGGLPTVEPVGLAV